MHRTAALAALCLLLTASACQGELDRTAPGGDEDMRADMSAPSPDMLTGADMLTGGPDMEADMDAPDAPPDVEMDAPDAAQDMEPAGFSAERSGVFGSRTCAPGCAPNQTRYTSRQRSLASMEEAEALAHQDVLAQGQAYADAQGACDCAPRVCPCGDFTNHGPAAPHLYGNAYTGELVGEVLAECRPNFWIEGLMSEPAPMMEAGHIEGTNKKLWRYAMRDDGTPRNTHIQSPGGCMDYPDIRPQGVPPLSETRTEWSSLPSVAALPPATDPIPFFISTELEGQDINAAPVWTVGTTPPVANMQLRVNGGEWRAFEQRTWGYFVATQPFELSQVEYLTPPKDFIMEITTDGGASAQRFVVYRTSQGGHYSVITTMTRQDGEVQATVQLIQAEVRQRLIHNATGRVYPSHGVYNHIFALGQLPEGEHIFSLWTSDDVLVDAHILINVRRPQ